MRTLASLVALASIPLLSGASVDAGAERGALGLLPSSPLTISAATRRIDLGGNAGAHAASAAPVRRGKPAPRIDALFEASAHAPGYTPVDPRPEVASAPLPPGWDAPDDAGLRIVTEGELRRGQTLASALTGQGVSSRAVATIAREMRPILDFRRARPGDRFRLEQDPDGAVVEFGYRSGRSTGYRLWRDGATYRTARDDEDLTSRIERLAGVVSSTVYEAVLALGERSQVANDFVGIFAWDIDFSRSTRPGDEFSVVYERLYRTDERGHEVYVRPGRILAARYRNALHGELEAFYFEPGSGTGGYYRRDGTPVQGRFLVSPLAASRLTSPYTRARRHPILKITRPHPGIDYAAPLGTPAYSVADGEVIYRGWAGGFGKLVKVRHAKGYVSYYAHLSRFAGDLQVGSRVSQKQVIGYVGMTGLATGPHVCFRIKKDGRWVDPLTLRAPAGDPVPVVARSQFESARNLLMAQLGGATLAATQEAL